MSRGQQGTDLDDTLDQVEARYAQAQEAVVGYSPEAAAALLDECEALLGTLADRADDAPRALEFRTRILITRSWTAFEQHGHAVGLTALEAAITQAGAIDRRDLLALCHMQAASMLARSGDLTGSLAWMARAAANAEVLPLRDQVRLALNRGTLASRLMELDTADTELERGAELARSAGEAAFEFMALHNRGYVQFLRGDLPAALALMTRADAMTVEVSRSVSELDRARVLLEAGLHDDAAHSLRTAHGLALAEGTGQDLAEIELDQARTALLLGDAGRAARTAALARRHFRERSAGPWRRQALLVELEARGYAGRDPLATARLAGWLAQIATHHGEADVATRANLLVADVLTRATASQTSTAEADKTVAAVEADEQRERARTAYLHAAPLRRSASLATRLHLHYVGAQLALPGNPQRASRILRRAAEDLAAATARASSLDLRTALAIHSGRLSELDLDLAMATGSTASVFARTERWRAVSERVPLVRPPRDPQAAALLTRLRRVREDLRGAPPADRPALRGQASDLERQLRALDWSGAASVAEGSAAALPAPAVGAKRDPIRPMSHATAMRAVREREATVVSYFLHRHTLCALVLSPRGSRLLRLAERDSVVTAVHRVVADAEALALPTPGPMRAVIERSLHESLAALERLVLGPLTAQRLVVVPNRLLSSLPWGMLPSRRGLPTTVARTVTRWAGGVGAPPSSGPSDAPPTDAHPTDRYAVRPGPLRVTAIAGPDLEHADTEVAQVAAIWGGEAVPTTRSNEHVLDAALHGSDLVHLAAHGRHQRQSPLFSSVRLGDGPVFAHELAGPLTTTHVVLSACEVGRATPRAGDEALGLTAALLGLGVHSVVAATTRIPDDVAAAAMTAYHRLLHSGLDAAAALAAAVEPLPLVARAFTVFGSDWSAPRPSAQPRQPERS
ncbi:MAG: CHAT domain-containing protein [Actinomycetales bacterium]|nr:CHAT domain-containing protein [Actinomycetales bacterium]